jgi:hypothetical protein
MFGHDHGEDQTALQQELSEHGERAVAAILSQSPHDVRGGTIEWHFVLNVSAGGKWHKVDLAQRLPDDYDFRQGEMRVPVVFDPAKPSRIMVDLAALPEFIAAAAAASKARQVGGTGARPATPSWLLPAHCPNCGAAVDQAVQSVLIDPRCTFCHDPLPVQPESAAT